MDQYFSASPAGDSSDEDYGASYRPCPAFYVRVRLVNHAQLEAAFDEDVAVAVLNALADRAADTVSGILSIALRGNGLDIVLEMSRPFMGAGRTGENTGVRLLEQAFAPLGMASVACGGHRLFASLAVAACRFPSQKARSGESAIEDARSDLDAMLRDRGPHLAPPDSAAHWSETYAADMRTAALAFDAMAQDGVVSVWQPILGGEGGQMVLYSEGIWRVADADNQFGPGNVASLDALVPALERTGLTRALDAHLVKLTMARLKREPMSRLGCHITAQSAVLDGWWVDIIDELKAQPDLAVRLVLEITETATFSGLAIAIDFAREMRRLGCGIAIGGFGRERMAVSEVAALDPDIIKIDALFLRQTSKVGGLKTFCHLVSLAATLARDVVVDGVASEEGARLAVMAGARWMQGSFMAAPSMFVRRDRAARPQPMSPDIAATFDKPVLVMPLRHWIINLTLGVGLWGAMGCGAWLVLGR